jgi:PAS domain S-box-containing protein
METPKPVPLKWFYSVRTRLFLAFSALVVLIAGFIYLYFPASLYEQALSGVKDQAKSYADFLAFTLSPAIDFDDPVSGTESMEAAQQNKEVAYVMVMGKLGKPFASFGLEIAMGVDFKKAANGSLSPNGNLWMTSAPVMRQETEIGKVYVGFSLDKMKSEVRRSKQLIALISMVLLVVGVGFVFWVSTVLTRSLSSIVRVVDRIAAGDFSQRASVNSKDEVGILAQSFNGMVDRVQASTEALAKREAQFRSLAQSMNEGLLQLGEDLHIRYANPRLSAMLGRDEGSLQGKHFTEITGEKSLPHFDPDSETKQMELQLRNPSDKLLWILLSYSFGTEQNGERTITVIFTDITTLKLTERDLLYKNRELDTFVYKASHDLKAPLSSLRGLVSIAQEDVKGPEAEQYFGLIERTINKMDDVLQGLLEVTWIKQGAMEYQVIYMRDLVQTILRSIEHSPGFHTVTIRVNIPDHCVLNSDLKMLNSILQNLMHNAIKYHREDGDDKWVSISVTETEKTMRISIKDNGPGIPITAQEKLFDMFFRASTKSQGSGLGLYIVKNSIEKMGGTVSLFSEVGIGSEFVVELPKS